MITRIGLSGFKIFGPEGLDLPLAPITILLGENSIGKSSVFQALLALQQSWDSPASIGHFTPTGRLVDLGRFGSLLHRRGRYSVDHVRLSMEADVGGGGIDGARTRYLEFEWDDRVGTSIPEEMERSDGCPPGWPEDWQELGTTDRGDLRRVQLGFRREAAGLEFRCRTDPETGRLTFTLASEAVEAWLHGRGSGDQLLRDAFNERAEFCWHFDLGSEDFPSPTIESTLTDKMPGSPEPASPNLDKLRALVAQEPRRDGSLWQEATVSLGLLRTFRKAISSVAHIGGIRERGRRIYEPRLADDPWRVGRSGDRMVDVLLNYPGALRRTNELLASASIGYQLDLKNPETHACLREILLVDQRRGPGRGNQVSLPDVGTGIAQMLPIAVQIAAMSETARIDTTPMLLVEQPELHLHPALQARLAKLLVEAVVTQGASREQRAVQFLIETHSEHLVLALGLLIYQKKIEPEAISVVKLFRDQESHRVVARRIEFSRDGRFKEKFPEGFFPERLTIQEGALP